MVCFLLGHSMLFRFLVDFIVAASLMASLVEFLVTSLVASLTTFFAASLMAISLLFFKICFFILNQATAEPSFLTISFFLIIFFFTASRSLIALPLYFFPRQKILSRNRCFQYFFRLLYRESWKSFKLILVAASTWK